MARRDIGQEIIEGLEEIKAWRLGRAKLRTTTIELPRAVSVPAIRKDLGLSQAQFASLMGVSVATLRNWEQGRREPHGPARSLLLVASREPAAVLKALTPFGASKTDVPKPAGAAMKGGKGLLKPAGKPGARAQQAIGILRGTLKHIRMSTDQILALTRGKG